MPRKKNKNKLIASSIIIIIILAGLSFGIYKYVNVPQTAISGFTAISIDKVEKSTSSFGPLQGPLWIITFVQGGLGSYAYGEFTPEDVGENNPGDELPKYPFTMRVDYENQECIYDIRTSSDPNIYNQAELVEFFGTSATDCKNRGNEICGSREPLVGYYSFFQCNVICATRRTDRIGNLDSPDTNIKFKVTVESQGESYSKDFETLGEASGLVTEGVVGPSTYIQWVGNLNSGKTCKSESLAKPIYRTGLGWQLSDPSIYDSYKNHFETKEVIPLNDESYQIWIDELNKLGRLALNDISFGDGIRDITSLTSGKVFMEIQDDIQFPEITAYIKTDWIGIHTPIGIPKIISAELDSPSISNRGLVKVIVENEGDEEGLFDLYGTCPSPFSITDTQKVSLVSGQRKTEYLDITASVQVDTTRTCTVYFKSPAKTVSKTFTVKGVPSERCIPNHKQCTIDNSGVEICNADLNKYVLFKNCELGCDYDANGQPYCKEDGEPGNGGNGIICPVWVNIENPIPNQPPLVHLDSPLCFLIPYFNIVAIVGGVIGFISLLLFTVGKFAIKKKGRKKKIDRILFGIFFLLSLGFGFLLWVVLSAFLGFFITLIGFITFIIIMIVMFILPSVLAKLKALLELV